MNDNQLNQDLLDAAKLKVQLEIDECFNWGRWVDTMTAHRLLKLVAWIELMETHPFDSLEVESFKVDIEMLVGYYGKGETNE